MHRLLTAALVLLVAGCASLAPVRIVDIPQARLQALLTQNLRTETRVLSLIDVSVGEPAVTLLPDENRIRTALRVEIRNALVGIVVRGDFAGSAGLRFDPDARTVVLAEPRIEAFSLAGPIGVSDERLNRIGSILAEQLMSGAVLYRLKAEDLKVGPVSYEPTDFRVTSDALRITLSPVK